MQREFAKRNVILNSSYPLYASKEGSLDYLFTGKHKQAFGLPRSCLTYTGHGKCVDMTAYVSQIFFFFLKNDGHGRTRLGHGLCYQKKKSVTHYLSHQSPPTSSHIDLLRCQSSSHPDLFFFSFSSIYFSFAVPPFALILVLFVSFFSLLLLLLFFFFSYFTLSHMQSSFTSNHPREQKMCKYVLLFKFLSFMS